MRDYVESGRCKREVILSHFGFPVPPQFPQHNCCDFHRQKCNCDDCQLMRDLEAIDEDDCQPKDTAESDTASKSNTLTAEQMDRLLEELQDFRLSLPGIGRSCVGSTSLATGITLDLLEQICQNAQSFNSIDDLEDKLPLFSHSHAISIWEILKKYQ